MTHASIASPTGHGADADAGVVAALGEDIGLARCRAVDGGARA
jgi:hypothetical protein